MATQQSRTNSHHNLCNHPNHEHHAHTSTSAANSHLIHPDLSRASPATTTTASKPRGRSSRFISLLRCGRSPSSSSRSSSSNSSNSSSNSSSDSDSDSKHGSGSRLKRKMKRKIEKKIEKRRGRRGGVIEDGGGEVGDGKVESGEGLPTYDGLADKAGVDEVGMKTEIFQRKGEDRVERGDGKSVGSRDSQKTAVVDVE